MPVRWKVCTFPPPSRKKAKVPVKVTFSNELPKGSQILPRLVRNHPVTEGMKDWLHLVSIGEAEFSRESVFRMMEIMTAPKSQRHGRFSPSSIGSCMRRQAFTYLGMTPDENSDATVMFMGTWAHLRWQLVGLTMDFLSEVEVLVPQRESPVKMWGSVDGICPDGTGFELKTTSEKNYKYMLQHGPSPAYLAQMQAYMELGDIEEFVLVYENRNGGETVSWVLPRDRKIGVRLIKEVEETVFNLEQGTLPPMLLSCIQQTGFDYSYCPYRISCPNQGSPCSTTDSM
jgi:hypothetical protein